MVRKTREIQFQLLYFAVTWCIVTDQNDLVNVNT